MEGDLPLPIPDRRIVNNKNYYIKNIDYNNDEINNELTKDIDTKYNDLKVSKISTMSVAQIKQIEDMRQKLLSYKLLSDKTIYMNSFQPNQKINKCNLIIFGPSGGGKSSFINSLYRSLYNSPIFPHDTINNLIIRKKSVNESGLLLSLFHLVKESENNSGIIICDTRGHIKMNNNEKGKFKILLDGQIKDAAQLEQNLNRDQKSLWEFWNKPIELFPKEIFEEQENKGNIKCIPHSVIFIFDGNSEEIIKSEDIKFYQDLVEISKDKGYKDIHVILSKVDEFENNIRERNKDLPDTEIHSKINTMKDIKIEKIISLLGVNRSNVHFIENYHLENQDTNLTTIDYNILKTLVDIINTSELFILDKMNKSITCYGLCS